MRPNSDFKTLCSSLFKPPPPYSLGQSGAVQPLAPILSIHNFCSSLLNVHLRPPQH